MKKKEDISLGRIIAKWLRENGVDAILEDHHRDSWRESDEPTVHVLLADTYGKDEEWPRLELSINGTKVGVTPRFRENPWDHRVEVCVTHPESFQQLKSIIDKFKEEYENGTAAAG